MASNGSKFRGILNRRILPHSLARFDWAMTAVNRDKVVEITVYGTGECGHAFDREPRDRICMRCKGLASFSMRIIGFFNSDLRHERYLFWALLAEEGDRDSLIISQPPAWFHGATVPPLPEGKVQLVRGLYCPANYDDYRWIEPCSYTLQELYALLYNLAPDTLGQTTITDRHHIMRQGTKP